MKPSEAAAEALGAMLQPLFDPATAKAVGGDFLNATPDDGDPRSIGERLDALAEIERLAEVMYRWGADSWDYPLGGGFTSSLPAELRQTWRDIRRSAL